MIAFGCVVTWPETYVQWAQPGVERAAEPDSEVYPFQASGWLARTYNLILDRAAARDDLEALVLIRQDAEIVDPDMCAKVRRVFEDPDVAVAGCDGFVGVRSIAWWEAKMAWSSSTYRYGQSGGGEIPTLEWSRDNPAERVEPGEVELVEESLMVLSPWTVRNIRFDESLSYRYAADFDLCMQVREAGRKVVAADFRLVHHHSLDLVTENDPWMAAHMRAAEKWDGRIPGAEPPDPDWRRRARRAEAEAAALRLVVASRQYQADALAKEQERELRRITETRSWKITRPLRAANDLRRRLRS